MGERWAREYLSGHDSKDPLASPLFADLTGFPPLYIQAGDAEILIDQIRDFEARAKQQRADVTLDVWPGMTHEFQIFAAMGIPEAKDALQKLGEKVDQRLS